MNDVLDRRHNAAVVEVFAAWMQEPVWKDALRHALTVSGEIDPWDNVTLGTKDCGCLDEAVNIVTDLLNTFPPGRPIHELTRTNRRLGKVADRLRRVRK